jgi:prolipoprotein diacylglyceryltransferase
MSCDAARIDPQPAANGAHAGPLFIHAYGVMYVLGVLAAIRLTTAAWARRGGDRDLVYDVALWASPPG